VPVAAIRAMSGSGTSGSWPRGAGFEQIHRRARAAYGDEAGEISALRLYEDAAGIRLRLGQC
jgi:hypothetical protein